MNPFQLQLLLMSMPSVPQKAPIFPKHLKKRLVRQFKRHVKNKRANRHIFTNKDMKM